MFDPKLVDLLVSEHRELVACVGRLEAAANRGQAALALHELEEFRSRLTDHLLVENTRFYLYVKAALTAHDPESAALARQFQREMSEIGKTVLSFVDRYLAVEAPPLTSSAFRRDLNEIAGALANRIAREEATLYPLYAPPSHFLS